MDLPQLVSKSITSYEDGTLTLSYTIGGPKFLADKKYELFDTALLLSDKELIYSDSVVEVLPGILNAITSHIIKIIVKEIAIKDIPAFVNKMDLISVEDIIFEPESDEFNPNVFIIDEFHNLHNNKNVKEFKIS